MINQELDITNIGTWLHDFGDRCYRMWEKDIPDDDCLFIRITNAIEIVNDILIEYWLDEDQGDPGSRHYIPLSEIRLAYYPSDQEKERGEGQTVYIVMEHAREAVIESTFIANVFSSKKKAIDYIKKQYDLILTLIPPDSSWQPVLKYDGTFLEGGQYDDFYILTCPVD